jgi:hypothetical protein
MKRSITLAICLWIACLFAQDGSKRDPRELVGVPGQTTLTDKVRALRLPYKAKLLGVFDWDRDGRAEIFAGWQDVMTLFTDLDHDGTAEIVSLEDNRTDSAGAQRPAVYKMEGETFRRIAEASAPWPQIAIFSI